MGPFLVFLSVVFFASTLGYRTDGESCDVFCMNNVETLRISLFQDLGALMDGGNVTLQCTSRAIMSACFDAIPECTEDMDQTKIAELIDYVCTNKPEFVTNELCFEDDQSSEITTTCFGDMDPGNYCNMPTCVQTGLSAVSSCTSDGVELAYNMFSKAINSHGC